MFGPEGLGPQLRRSRSYAAVPGILEALELEEVVVLPGLRMILADIERGGAHSPVVEPKTIAALRSSIVRHERSVDVLTSMLVDSLVDHGRAAEYLRTAPGALPVRAQRSIVADALNSSGQAKADATRLAFLFVAVHALTDPSDCATASPALNLVPPPLHRDRSSVGTVIAQMIPRMRQAESTTLHIVVSKASTFFAAPDRERWTYGPALARAATPASASASGAGDLAANRENGETDEDGLSLVRYNPHALRASCAAVGLHKSMVRIADEQKPPDMPDLVPHGGASHICSNNVSQTTGHMRPDYLTLPTRR